jgi:hypothetical protein
LRAREKGERKDKEYKRNKESWSKAQVTESLPSKFKALSSNPCTEREEKYKERRKKG